MKETPFSCCFDDFVGFRALSFSVILSFIFSIGIHVNISYPTLPVSHSSHETDFSVFDLPYITTSTYLLHVLVSHIDMATFTFFPNLHKKHT